MKKLQDINDFWSWSRLTSGLLFTLLKLPLYLINIDVDYTHGDRLLRHKRCPKCMTGEELVKEVDRLGLGQGLMRLPKHTCRLGYFYPYSKFDGCFGCYATAVYLETREPARQWRKAAVSQ